MIGSSRQLLPFGRSGSFARLSSSMSSTTRLKLPGHRCALHLLQWQHKRGELPASSTDVMCLHNALGAATNWARLASALRGHEAVGKVMAYDRPGHGAAEPCSFASWRRSAACAA